MKKRPDPEGGVIRWVDKAEHDLRAAEHLLQFQEGGLTDIVCFHCQQCAEKYLKALLVALGVRFPNMNWLFFLRGASCLRGLWY